MHSITTITYFLAAGLCAISNISVKTAWIIVQIPYNRSRVTLHWKIIPHWNSRMVLIKKGFFCQFKHLRLFQYLRNCGKTREINQNAKSCSKCEELPKIGWATCGKPYWHSLTLENHHFQTEEIGNDLEKKEIMCAPCPSPGIGIQVDFGWVCVTQVSKFGPIKKKNCTLS